MKIGIGIVKFGCLGVIPILEYLLDERAERNDITVRVYSTASKLTEEDVTDIAKLALNRNHDMYIIASPNITLPGPRRGVEILRKSEKPLIIISDTPSVKVVKELDELGVGYIITLADPMIGARREFLDPTEMAIFNSDIIKVLAVSGVYRIIYREIDRVIESLKRNEKPELPKLIIDKNIILQETLLVNPYAKAKIIAAFEIARHVAEITYEACFKVKEWERYTQLVASAHEMLRIASKLADEAREIDKYLDQVLRQPHNREGKILTKYKLVEKPRIE